MTVGKAIHNVNVNVNSKTLLVHTTQNGKSYSSDITHKSSSDRRDRNEKVANAPEESGDSHAAIDPLSEVCTHLKEHHVLVKTDLVSALAYSQTHPYARNVFAENARWTSVRCGLRGSRNSINANVFRASSHKKRFVGHDCKRPKVSPFSLTIRLPIGIS